MTIDEKYAQYRAQIDNGDIIGIKGKSLLSKTISWGDSKDDEHAYLTHALVAMKDGDRLLALESEAHGVRPDFLSQVIADSLDFVILKPLVSQARKDEAVNAAFDEGAKGIPYNYAMLPKVLMYRKFGWDIKKLGDDNFKNICSVFAAQTYGGLLPLPCYSRAVINQDFITPQDLIRFRDPGQVGMIATEKLGSVSV